MVKEVAFREIRSRARTKSFRWITGILVAAAIAGPILVTLLPDGGGEDLREVTIGVSGVDQDVKDQILAFAVDALDVTFVDLDSSSDQVDQALSEGDINLALEPGPTLIWNSRTDFQIANVVYTALQQQQLLVRGRAMGLDQGDIVELLTPVALEERFANETDESEGVTIFVAFLGLMAAFMLPQIYGQLTMMSVIEEKSTRVIEVLLNHLRPRTLLMGKVLGVGALAVMQLIIVVAGLTAALLVTDSIDIPHRCGDLSQSSSCRSWAGWRSTTRFLPYSAR